jgi:hypothetical protein
MSMHAMHEARRGAASLLGVLLAAVFTAGACASTPATAGPSAAVPAPSGPALLGIDWGRAASVERPANFDATLAPSDAGVHPILRIPGQATIADVMGLPGGGYTAIGYAPPLWQPMAWTSADGTSWAITSMGTTDFTFPAAVAAGGNGHVVAVGRSRNAPVAWTTVDGESWERRSVPTLEDRAAERMNAVVGTPAGFVAGGSAGPELGERHARFWTSPNGVDWDPAPDDASTFANSEVRAIAAHEGGFVAVGVVGTAQVSTAAVAWTSADGRRWTRVDAPAFAGGVAVSVVSAPFGRVVAVGSDVERRNAVAWLSADGSAWTRAPDEPARQHSGGYAWLTDVAAIGDEVVSVGVIQGLQRGTAMSWVSRDGLAWARANRSPVQEGAEFYAIVPRGSGAMAVGAFGAPDSYVPEVWLTPGR